MENSKKTSNISYIKTDDQIIFNEATIRWVKKVQECLEVCTKSTGCDRGGGDTHKVCKLNSPDSYKKLNAHFE